MTEQEELDLPIKTEIEVPELTSEQRVKLWDAVIAAIRAEGGAHYNQVAWTDDGDESTYAFTGHCGTVACVAGHAIHEAVVLGILPPFRYDCGQGGYLTDPAGELLGLDEDTREDLFSGGFTPASGYTIDGILEKLRDRQKETGLNDEAQASFLASMTIDWGEGEGEDEDEVEPDFELEGEAQ